MSVSAVWDAKLSVLETVDLAMDLVASDPSFTHSTGSVEATINASSTVPATKVWSDTGALVAGVATLDLTALTHGTLNGTATTVTFSGLKVQLVKIECPSTNTASLKVAMGAANGYNIFGATTGEMDIPQGGSLLFYGSDKLDDVSGTDKTIDLSSTHLTAAYNIILVAG